LRRRGLSFQATWVDTRKGFLRELDQNPPDVVLSDHGVPSFDGFAALKIVRGRIPQTPFIFVTNDKSEELAVKSLRDGATDYVLKERLAELVPAVQRALRLAAHERNALKEIRRLNAELDLRIEERRGEWERASHEMETFSHSVSHDLRAPLIRIGGFADLLREYLGPRLGEKGRHYLDIIAASASKMGQMLDDLLAFSVMSQAELHHVRINLVAMLQDVVKDLEAETQNRAIDWVIGDLPEVWGDPSLLRQAICHLVANAVKYTRNCPRARIEIGSRTADREMIFFIRDNGVGFDMKFADRLFGVFQRLHAASEFEGHGVGLANVRRIIARHGGHTWAEGVPDKGATFSFSLPIGKEIPDDLVKMHSPGGG
jgi:light-regulated signal transduction histidine kinase (bacteriophytochrome)